MYIVQIYSPYLDAWQNTPNIHLGVREALSTMESRKSMALQQEEVGTKFRLVKCEVLDD